MDAEHLGEAMHNKPHAMLLAVEVLLSDPEALCNDALETDLYILRERLSAQLPPTDAPAE
jgi:hypothetical protein